MSKFLALLAICVLLSGCCRSNSEPGRVPKPQNADVERDKVFVPHSADSSFEPRMDLSVDGLVRSGKKKRWYLQ